MKQISNLITNLKGKYPISFRHQLQREEQLKANPILSAVTLKAVRISMKQLNDLQLSKLIKMRGKMI